MRKVLGIDILPGESPVKGEEARYACVLLLNGEVKRRFEGITLREILDLIKAWRIDAIATDNIFELASNKEGLINIFKRLESPPKIIEVTRIGDKKYKLESIASSLSLFRGKPSPLDSAEVCAKLAFMGIGSEALFFEDETRITISRGRSPTQGGMSRERYKRNVELTILRLTREIKDILESRGIDYDLYVRKAASGLESSLFIIYAPRSQLYGLIRKRKGYDVHIDIEPVSKTEIEFIPLSSVKKIRRTPERYLILGIDPGISTGVALLTLDGYVIDLFSKRWMSRRQLIKYLSGQGKVLIVATDVNPPSVYAKKLASSLNATLFVPPRNLTVEEKREIVSNFVEKTGYLVKIKDAHQRDALSAALKALNYYASKLKEVDKELDKLGLELPTLEIKAMVIKGASIDEAIQKVSEKYLIPSPIKYVELRDKKDVDGLYKALRKLENELIRLRIENRNMSIKIKELLEEIKEREERIEKLLNFQNAEFRRSKYGLSLESRISALSKELTNLSIELEILKREKSRLEDIMVKILKGEIIGVPLLEKLDKKSLGTMTHIKGKILAVKSLAGYEEEAIQILLREKPKALLILQGENEYLKERLEMSEIPVIDVKIDEVIEIKKYCLIDSEKFISLLKDSRKRIKERKELWKEKIKTMLIEYKKERARFLERNLRRD